MAAADFVANQENQSMPEPLNELLIRLRHIRRRLERWMPSSDSIALWSYDYADVFGAAKRLEATVGELDSGIEECHSNPQDATLCLHTLLDKLERSTSEFEDSIIRNTAVA